MKLPMNLKAAMKGPPMSDRKFFRIQNGRAVEFQPRKAELERNIQTLFEQNLEALLGARFLASEYSLYNDDRRDGRMDTLGLDKQHRPVVIEYKRDVRRRIINQVLGYATDLAERYQRKFEILVREKVGLEAYGKIPESWTPQVICVAANFTEADRKFAKSIPGLKLVQYSFLGEGENKILMLEWVVGDAPERATKPPVEILKPPPESPQQKRREKKHHEHLAEACGEQKERLDTLMEFFRSLGNDVKDQPRKKYHKVMHDAPKAFATFTLSNQKNQISVCIRLDLKTVELIEGFTEDVTDITPAGANLRWEKIDKVRSQRPTVPHKDVNLRINITSAETLERAKPLLRRAYEEAER